MSLTVRLHGALRRYLPAGARELRLDLPEGATVADVLRRAGVPQEHAGIFALDGEQVDAGHPVIPGRVLEVFPPLSGGC